MLSVKAKLWVNKMIIYKVRNKINNKIYIGQIVNTLDVRRSQNERSYDYGKRTAFSNAIHIILKSIIHLLHRMVTT